MATITKPLMVYLPDTRGVQVSSYGKGNLKIGAGVYTYSRLPGRPDKPALGYGSSWQTGADRGVVEGRLQLTERTNYPRTGGTCPGSSPECERICYASRPVAENGVVEGMWQKNSLDAEIPPIPEDAKLIRLHISGDFDTEAYIENWIYRLEERPDVVMWAYTRSWRVASLLPSLERLRALPNVQLFASMDKSIPEMPPDGWRRAWIDGDERAGRVYGFAAHTRSGIAGNDLDANSVWLDSMHLERTADGTKGLLCPEETKSVLNCEECGFCFKGQRNDVVFLQH